MKTLQTLMISTLLCTLACTGPEQLCLDAPAEGHEILFAAGAFADSLIVESGIGITDQSAWDNFLGEFTTLNQGDALSRTEIDWSTEQVAVASVFVSSSCGLSVVIAETCEIDGATTVQLAVEDRSGSCRAVCDMEEQRLLIAAVPHGELRFVTEVLPACY